MPSSLIAGAIAALGSEAAPLWAFVQAAALSLVVRAASGGLRKQSKQNAFGAEGRLTTLREPIAPRQVIFGQARVGGVITFAHVQNSGSGYFFHLVVTLAGHTCDSIPEVWLDDEKITAGMLDASGLVTSGRFRNVAFVAHTLRGTVPASPFQVVLTDAGPLGLDGLNGLDSAALISFDGQGEEQYTQMTDVSPAAPANATQYKLTGTGPVTVTFHASAEGSPFVLNYRLNQSGAAVRIQKSLGAEAGQPFPDLVAASEGTWTDAHRQSGCAKLYIRLSGDIRFFPAGIPNITAVVKGENAVLDPRTGLTGWTDNAALLAAHYLSNARAYGFGAAYASEIHTADLIAAANLCDEAVALAAGGTEARYRANGAFLMSEKPGDVLARLLAAMAGSAVEVGDRWRVYAGGYTAPTVTLDEGDLRGGLRTEVLPDLRDNCNAVKGTFVSPVNNWQPTDFPPIASTTYLAEDNNERLWRDIDLTAFVTSATQAQRLAKIELLRTRQALTVTAPWKLAAYATVPGKTVSVTNGKYGWAPKVFEIFSSRFVIEPDEQGNPCLGVDQVLRETAAAVYAWSTSEEQTVDLAPNTSLPDVFAYTVVAPGAPSVVEQKYETTGSAGVKVRAVVSLGTVSDPFFDHLVLEWKGVSESAYHVVPLGRGGNTANVDDLRAGTYLFRSKTVNSAARESLYSPITTQDLIGLSDAPSDATGFAVQAYAGQAKFTWDKPTSSRDLDVIIGGRAWVRWSPLTVAATWEHGSLVNPDGYPGDTTIGMGPLLTGTYLLKFQDAPASGGNFSANAASFVVTEAVLQALTGLVTVTESPTFPGAKTNVAAVDGALQMTSGTNWDSYPGNIDDWLSPIDSMGGIAATGSYVFNATLDLGSVKSVRLSMSIASLAFDNADFFDDRTQNIDDWVGMFDGTAIEDVEATGMVRITNDDPAGTPTWGPWHALGLVGDYVMRAAQGRLDFTNGSPNHNRRVTALSLTARQ
jgi:hypothetical protein